MKIVTSAQMNRIDRECARQGTPVNVLMENAGKAVAVETRRSLGMLNAQHILCLIGAGNNGGDGLVAARYLRELGAKVSVYLCSSRPPDDANLKLVQERRINYIDAKSDTDLTQFDKLLGSATCVIDALLGTGKMRPLEGVFKEVLEKITAEKAKRTLFIVAVDLPSGMDANTGAIDPACPSADLTVTLAFPKPGLFMFPGAERVGKLVIADIGIPASLADSITTELLTYDWAGTMLPRRPPNSNKGTFGKVMVVAGSGSYIGAAFLACSGALRAGAGLVTLAAAASLSPVIASRLAEATYLPLPEEKPGIVSPAAAAIVRRECAGYDIMLIGCGLGQDAATVKFVSALLGKKGLPRLVVDADALNIISKLPKWWQKLPGNAILTPHPGEMSRLCGLPVEKIQADRLNTAIRFAGEWQKTVVLKGAYTVIAAPDGRCRVSPFANPGLASAGTGDVLAGVIAGLAAQGLESFDDASLGVFLHGETGEQVKNELGDTGMIASDLLQALPVAIKKLKNRG
jgi:ADP-dependent NAD(P)H-hydrate dehydratase / NAD(P)H-hydrate epimerase